MKIGLIILGVLIVTAIAININQSMNVKPYVGPTLLDRMTLK